MRSLVVSILLAWTANAGSIMDYLLSGDTVPELKMTREIALKMDRKRLEGLTSQASGGLVIVLPTNKAWDQRPAWYEKLLQTGEAADKLRVDLIFAAGGEIDKVGGFDTLVEYVNSNGGVVDTAYGTPMMIDPQGKACIALYDSNWNVVPGSCAELQLPPMMFDDGSVYLTDNIILPDSLLAELE